MMRTEEFREFHPEIIEVLDRVRDLDDAKVDEIAASIEAIGQITPIVVFATELGDRIILVAGWHRLAAVKKLGREKIDCRIVEGEDVEYKLWEISENLHRSELTATERAEHIAEWARLVEERKDGQLVQPSGGVQPNDKGISAAARELPISGKTEGAKRKNVERAVKIAAITPAAKEAARDAGLDDNQSALLKVASYADEDQVGAVEAIVREKAWKAATSEKANRYFADQEKRLNAESPTPPRREYTVDLMAVWNAASEEEHAEFLMSAWLASTEEGRVEFIGKVGAAIVAALTPAQLHAAHKLHNRNAEQARRQARDPEEIERVKAQDRARQSKRYAQAHAA